MSPVEPRYAVTWHEPRRAPYAGTLSIGVRSLRFEGASSHGRPLGLTIPFSDLAAVRVARRPEDRVAGRPVLVLERRTGSSVHVATLGHPGALHELADRLRSASSTVTA